MDLFLRYRNVALLIAALFAQLVLLGYQVREEDGSRLLRTWTVGVLAPVNNALHGGVELGISAWREYVWLVGARSENEELRRELGSLKIENQALERELNRKERSAAVIEYQERIESETLLAEVVGGGASGSAKEVIINRGTNDGVRPGMAVITPQGIAGSVQAAHRSSSLVVLINDVDAAVGAILGDTRVRGVLRGSGDRECELNYVNPDVPVRVGETVYSSGADRIFPKGLPVGEVVERELFDDSQRILVRPFARLDRLDEVLVITHGTHQALPDVRGGRQATLLMPLPEETPQVGQTDEQPPASALDADLTDADRLRRQYERVGAAQGHVFGEGLPGSRPPDFNLSPDGPPQPSRAEPAE